VQALPTEVAAGACPAALMPKGLGAQHFGLYLACVHTHGAYIHMEQKRIKQINENKHKINKMK
jgi:hypothetical protein